jgi:hypothetical protein
MHDFLFLYIFLLFLKFTCEFMRNMLKQDERMLEKDILICTIVVINPCATRVSLKYTLKIFL